MELTHTPCLKPQTREVQAVRGPGQCPWFYYLHTCGHIVLKLVAYLILPKLPGFIWVGVKQKQNCSVKHEDVYRKWTKIMKIKSCAPIDLFITLNQRLVMDNVPLD